MAKKETKIDLEKLKAKIEKAETMQELHDLMRDLDPADRNKLTHQVYEATNRIVLGEGA